MKQRVHVQHVLSLPQQVLPPLDALFLHDQLFLLPNVLLLLHVQYDHVLLVRDKDVQLFQQQFVCVRFLLLLVVDVLLLLLLHELSEDEFLRLHVQDVLFLLFEFDLQFIPVVQYFDDFFGFGHVQGALSFLGKEEKDGKSKES